MLSYTWSPHHKYTSHPKKEAEEGYLQCWYSCLRHSSSEISAGIWTTSVWTLCSSWVKCCAFETSSSLDKTRFCASPRVCCSSIFTPSALCASLSIFEIFSNCARTCCSRSPFNPATWAWSICSSCCAAASSCRSAPCVAASRWFSVPRRCISACCDASFCSITWGGGSRSNGAASGCGITVGPGGIDRRRCRGGGMRPLLPIAENGIWKTKKMR